MTEVAYSLPFGMDPSTHASQLLATGLMRLAFERFGPDRLVHSLHPWVCGVCGCGSPHGRPCWYCNEEAA